MCELKGKYANRAVNSRAEVAEAEVVRLRAELKTVRTEGAKAIKELRDENGELTAEMVARAGELASAEVQRQIAAFHEERRRRGLSDQIVTQLMRRKDRLIMNACRYISMTTGDVPMVALEQVITWATDEDFIAATNRTGLFVELGVPDDGWVAWAIGPLNKYLERAIGRRRRRARAPLRPLDYVDEHLDQFDVHPMYDARWYAPETISHPFPRPDQSEQVLQDGQQVSA